MKKIDNSFFILGKPVKTDIGTFRFIKVCEFEDFQMHIPLLLLQKFQVIREFRKQINEENKEMLEQFIAYIEQMELTNIVKEDVYGLLNPFQELFKFVTGEDDLIAKINNDEEFDYYKELILEMNAIPNEKENPNPEIEEWNRLERYHKQMTNDHIDFEAVWTSVYISTGDNPMEMTIYQLYKLFDRIAQFKAYDTTTLFRTVGDVEIENWYKALNTNKEPETISMEVLEKKAGNL